MDLSPAEQQVVEVGLSRGYFDSDQLSAAKLKQQQLERTGTTSSLLPLLAEYLEPPHKAALRAIYVSAGRVEKDLEDTTNTLQVKQTTDTYMQTDDRPRVALLDPNQTFLPADQQPELVSPQVDVDPTMFGSTAGARAQRSAEAGEHEVIGDYEVLRELGRGGMGVVYEARSLSLERKVALKLLLRGASQALIDRFQVEAKAVARMRHPGIVGVLEQGQDPKAGWYMAMDLVEGESLFEKLEREGPLDPTEAAELTLELAEALSYAHGQKVLHRDLKPQNILLDGEGRALLTDFGLAKLMRGDADGQTAAQLTATGEVLGTPTYMAPEQVEADRRRIGERTDVYGLGATLYHMLTGNPPYVSSTVTKVLMQILNEPPPPPRTLDPDIPKDLETIVLKCLDKDDGARYPNMDALARDLSRYLKDLQIVATRTSGAQMAKRWAGKNRSLVGIGVGVLVVLAFVGAFAWKSIGDARAEALRVAEAKEREAEEKEQELERMRAALAEKNASPTPAASPSAIPSPSPEESPSPVASPTPETVPTPEVSASPTPQAPPSLEPSAAPTIAPSVAPSPEPSPPPAEKDPVAPEPPRAEELPAAMPPKWVVDRAPDDGEGRFTFAKSWEAARAEAKLRNVPLVVIAVKASLADLPKAFESEAFLEALEESAVVVAACADEHESRRDEYEDEPRRGGEPPPPPPRGGHPPPPRGGGPPPPRGGHPPPPRGGHPPPPPPPEHERRPRPEDERGRSGSKQGGTCALFFDAIECRDHTRVSREIEKTRHAKKLAPHKSKGIRFSICAPDGKRAVGLYRGISDKKVRSELRKVQKRLGEPKMESGDLAVAFELLAQPPDVRSVREVQALGEVVGHSLGLPEPVAAWARYRARELCDRAVDLVLGSRRSDRRKRADLEDLGKVFEDDAACLRILREAVADLK